MSRMLVVSLARRALGRDPLDAGNIRPWKPAELWENGGIDTEDAPLIPLGRACLLHLLRVETCTHQKSNC